MNRSTNKWLSSPQNFKVMPHMPLLSEIHLPCSSISLGAESEFFFVTPNGHVPHRTVRRNGISLWETNLGAVILMSFQDDQTGVVTPKGGSFGCDRWKQVKMVKRLNSICFCCYRMKKNGNSTCVIFYGVSKIHHENLLEKLKGCANKTVKGCSLPNPLVKLARHLALFKSAWWSTCKNSCWEPLRGFWTTFCVWEPHRCGFKNHTQWLVVVELTSTLMSTQNFHAGPRLRNELGMKTRLGSVVDELKMFWCVLDCVFGPFLSWQIVILVWFVKQKQVMEFGKSLFCLRLALPKQGWTSRTVWRKGPNHHWCLTACPCLHTPSWSTNSGFAMRQMHYRKKGKRERERCTCLLLWCGFVVFSEKCGSVKVRGPKIHSVI